MPGRNAQPVQLHILRGNPNRLTKAAIAARKAAEIKLSDGELVEPAYVATDQAAHGKWQELAAIYEEMDFVAAADSGLLAQYCMAYSQYLELLSHLQTVKRIEFSSNEEEYSRAAIEYVQGERAAERMWRKIDYIMSLGGILELNKAINQKLATMSSMQDRLFITPLARVKTIPKKPEAPPVDPAEAAGFGTV